MPAGLCTLKCLCLPYGKLEISKQIIELVQPNMQVQNTQSGKMADPKNPLELWLGFHLARVLKFPTFLVGIPLERIVKRQPMIVVLKC